MNLDNFYTHAATSLNKRKCPYVFFRSVVPAIQIEPHSEF